MLELKSENNLLLSLAAILLILESFTLLGFNGSRTISGLIIFIFLPFFLVFDSLNLSYGEKLIFSFFVGIMVFPSLVFWLGFVASFKAAIIIVFIATLSLGLFLKFYFRKKIYTHGQI